MNNANDHQQTFVQTITVNSTVYVLFFTQETTNTWNVTCRNVPLSPFTVVYRQGEWKVQGTLPDQQEFEERLNTVFHEEVQ